MVDPDDLVLSLSAAGRLRTWDGEAVLLYPEPDVDPAADLSVDHAVCGRCWVVFEVKHLRPMAEIEMPPCPFCGSFDWRETHVSRGISGSEPPIVDSSTASIMPVLGG